MIEGVLRHDTEMEIERQYVDSHGQSEVAFAFCQLLGFQLLPRLKAIAAQRLYLAEAGNGAYPNLACILARLAIGIRVKVALPSRGGQGRRHRAPVAERHPVCLWIERHAVIGQVVMLDQMPDHLPKPLLGSSCSTPLVGMPIAGASTVRLT